MTDRSTAVLLAVINLMSSGRRVRNCDAADLFRWLGRDVPGLTPDDLSAAAAMAKQIGSELRGLAWRIEQAAIRAKAVRKQAARNAR